MAGKRQTCGSHEEGIDGICWSWRTNIISWPRKFGIHSTWMQTEQNFYWVIQRNVWITTFCWSNRKITGMGQASIKNGRVVLRYGRTCLNMLWEILRTGEQKNKAVTQFLKSLLGWSSFQESGTWISWRIIKSMLSKIVLNCLYLARMGRPDILWSVNKLARSITKWTGACAKRSARSISYIFITHVGTDNIVMWVTRLSFVDWVYSKTHIFLVTSRTQKSTSGGTRDPVYVWKSNTRPQ